MSAKFGFATATLAMLLLPAVKSGAVDCSSFNVDSNSEPIVLVREDCTGLSNCFDVMDDLADTQDGWIWNCRFPTASSPLRVDVGPGTFDAFTCPEATPQNGHVSVHGAGREVTRLQRENPWEDVAYHGAVTAFNCDDLEFSDLRLEAVSFGVAWHGAGSSTWIDVDVVAGIPIGSSQPGAIGYGWYDTDPSGGLGLTCTTDLASHYWYGSKIRVEGGTSNLVAYVARCSNNWFYGGEIEAVTDQTGGPLRQHTGIYVIEEGDFRGFGVALRTYIGLKNKKVAAGGTIGVDVVGNGVFHTHGGIINTSTAGTIDGQTGQPKDADATNIRVSGNGFVHTPATAYVVSASGNGTAYRVDPSSTGIAQVPFLWPSGDEPPAVESMTGKDLFVETDCTSAGTCGGGATTEPHLMIFDEGCTTNGPWFDVVEGACRQ